MNHFLKFISAVLISWTSMAFANQKIVLISDVDDTIKISDVRYLYDKVSFSVFKDSLFFGMNLVYQAIAQKDSESVSSEFHYVSNGWKPTVEESHGAILNDFKFPDAHNYRPRNLKEVLTKVSHKENQIQSIVNQEQPDVLILVGDNGEKDPKTYHEMAKKIKKQYESEGREVKIYTYIHIVYEPKNKQTLDLMPDQIPFSNAAELAVELAERGLIKGTSAIKIINAVKEKLAIEPANSVYGPLVNPYFKYRKKTSYYHRSQCLRNYNQSPFVSLLNGLND
ncbi:MAG: DUF2183 domain-containing protein [Bdellovibrionales bacterium]|nr:DUF2183 domain-containing protein [Bdellovibrionales bacterium]